MVEAGQRSAVVQDLLGVLRLLVDRPEEVRVEEYGGRSSTLLEAAVDPSDLGKVIGRQGRTIDALRALIAARGEHYELEILED
jgi:predicted RNA-binding protein YlqC (UPF0109 family)